jgi:hypothetical protein
MAFLDFINNRNTSQQPSVAQTPPPEVSVSRSVESLPASVKAQAVEAACPAAELMDKATMAKDVNSRPSPPHTPARGRSLGMER